MPKLIYTPKALDDLQGIKTYISEQFGGDRAKTCVQEIATTVRQLEMIPNEGPCLQDLIECPTDYHYLAVKPNYIFYRILLHSFAELMNKCAPCRNNRHLFTG